MRAGLNRLPSEAPRRSASRSPAQLLLRHAIDVEPHAEPINAHNGGTTPNALVEHVNARANAHIGGAERGGLALFGLQPCWGRRRRLAETTRASVAPTTTPTV